MEALRLKNRITNFYFLPYVLAAKLHIFFITQNFLHFFSLNLHFITKNLEIWTEKHNFAYEIHEWVLAKSLIHVSSGLICLFQSVPPGENICSIRWNWYFHLVEFIFAQQKRESSKWREFHPPFSRNRTWQSPITRLFVLNSFLQKVLPRS